MNFKEEYNRNTKDVSLKETSNPDLFVLKYRRNVFYKNRWNDFLEECRGAIVDKDFNVVSLPFRKIYNFGVEDRAPKINDDETVHWFRKVNGFMVAMTWYDGDVLVSTTGSIDSDFVALAKKYLTSNLKEYLSRCRDYTLMFECCDPSDPHIVEEKAGLYFIGMRHKHSGDLQTAWLSRSGAWVAEAIGVMFPEHGTCTMGELKEMVRTVQHEGFVIYTDDGRSTKIKSKHYLVKKLFMRGNIEKLFDQNVKAKIDEEYFPLVDYIKENRDKFASADEATRRFWIEEFLTEQAKYEQV